MKYKPTPLKGAYIITPHVYNDERGEFYRIYCKEEIKSIDHNKEFIQVNHSITYKKGSVRGMHFQYPPYGEIKMVKCIRGKVFDVIIDIRKNSPTFLHWYGEILSAEKRNMFYIPEGFAHGFQTLDDNCELLYFHSEFYNKKAEGGLLYNDPLVNIEWKLKVKDISERDKAHMKLTKEFNGL